MGEGIMAWSLLSLSKRLGVGDTDDDEKSQHNLSLLKLLNLMFPISPQWPPCPSSDIPGALLPQDFCRNWYWLLEDLIPFPFQVLAPMVLSQEGLPRPPLYNTVISPWRCPPSLPFLHRLPNSTRKHKPISDLFSLSSPLECKLLEGRDFCLLCTHPHHQNGVWHILDAQ